MRSKHIFLGLGKAEKHIFLDFRCVVAGRDGRDDGRMLVGAEETLATGSAVIMAAGYHARIFTRRSSYTQASSIASGSGTSSPYL